ELEEENDDDEYVMRLSFKYLTNENLNESQIKQINDDFAIEIIPRLYLGSKRAALDEDWLKYNKITDILTVAQDIKPRFPKSFVYKVIPIRDSESQDISKYFEETFMFIQNVLDQEDRRILVHCEMGISRSPTVVIAYIMRSQKKSLKEAVIFVKERKSFVRPNSGFYRQLKEFGSELSLKNDSDSESELLNQLDGIVVQQWDVLFSAYGWNF
ncbi:2286_t:CDS:2, partial [Dentiscutata heterogama]